MCDEKGLRFRSEVERQVAIAHKVEGEGKHEHELETCRLE